ncbi:MAG: tRNA (adenosine(37)-N6)-threonylcarbamoyltransferase complex ATPase subunit type 1 TsaE [Gammaproteobacteria bacterium]|nr:tRNA (adenosine(37)-N6)-threonylcarbamoyltransferase complex ATPase subunit type 1 TsaE [Gammaproteobacteria bacterium]MDP2142031.1 tRNA (adenosine(37)-N6)-threonylcarbamoyltransferase complex ATPase subunit type 1 TsaE [Gammaproteobacteria bacterium]MDP2348390.1 tRNA (adenosine(37)-N6)-threonylcarbamoyltransferase complex ATPase subunit type 1 TsaE [Gammaproteobacteria bacterium]
MTVHTRYLEDETTTEALGRLLATATQPDGSGANAVKAGHDTLGGRIFLSGDLGAGKTTLTRGLMRGYGVQGAVKSPTYTLVEPYELDDCKLYHFDLYRLADPEEVEFLGVSEYFDEANLCVIEWAEKGKGYLPCPDLEIALSVEGEGRRITWVDRTAKGETIGHRLSVLSEHFTGRNL